MRGEAAMTDIHARPSSPELIDPTDAAFDAARTPWLVNVDLRPCAVAFPHAAGEVADLIHYARRSGRRIAMQSTGHHADTLGGLDQTILIRTSRMRKVTVDPVRRTARVGAGAVWSDVVAAAEPHGLAPLAGSAADVGVAGYTLGGGLSWMARRYGLACNNVVAIDVVTADGARRRIDADHEPDLFWAMRGGGGSFAAVVELEIALVPVADVFAGCLFWPIERGADVLCAWRRWTEDLPEEVTSCGRLLQFPLLPEIPEPLRGGSFVVVESVDIGSRDEAVERLRPLRAMSPQMDTVTAIGPTELLAMHMDPEGPVPALFDGVNLRDLPDEAVRALVAVAGAGSNSPLLSVELRHLGGGLNRTPAHPGALARLDGRFAEVAVGLIPDKNSTTQVHAALSVVTNALSPWCTGVGYSNFTANRGRPGRFFDPGTLHRLREVVRRYDPFRLFHSGLSLED
jgi:hypothetical protein